VTTPTTIHTPDGFIPQAPPGPPYLTLRDQFAMAALTGLLAAGDHHAYNRDEAAHEAWKQADAMMKKRGE
jgi:hypothetical protein